MFRRPIFQSRELPLDGDGDATNANTCDMCSSLEISHEAEE